MATTKTENSLKNKITLVDTNGENLKNKDGNDIIVEQSLSIPSTSTHYFEFSDKIIKEDGASEKRELFSIDKTEENVYTINFSDLSLFTASDGQTLSEKLGKDPLVIKQGQGGISISNKHGATCFQIQATSGETYTISTDATSVSIQNEDGLKFSHASNYEAGVGIDVAMSTDAVEAFFDQKNEIFQTYNNADEQSYSRPKKLNDFPFKNLALYFQTFKGNQSKSAGDFTFLSIDPISANQDEIEKTRPYCFISVPNTKDKSLNINYFLINGKFQKLEKMILQYEEVKDKDGKIVNIPKLVIETKFQSGRTKASFGIDLKLNEDGTFSEQSKQAIEMLKKITNYEKTAKNSTDISIDGFEFEKKDDRNYSTYNYKLSPENYKLVIENTGTAPEVEVEIIPPTDDNKDEENTNVVSKDDEEKHNFVTPDDGEGDPDNGDTDNNNDSNDDNNDSNETEESNNKDNNNDVNESENPAQAINNQETPAKETPKKEKDEDEVVTKSTKAHDLKKFAENYGTAISVIGFFLAIGAILTGVGILAIIALGIVTAGTGMIAFKDKFEIKSFDIAYKRVKEREKEEAEAEDFAENFLAKEKELDKATVAMETSEKELSNFISITNEKAKYPENSFYEIYEKYGIGFSHGIEEIHDGYPRTEKFMSIDGLDIKRNMLTSLKTIQTETKSKNRTKLIDNFINSNFRDIPEKRKQEFIENMFQPEFLDPFVSKLDSAVREEQNVSSIIEYQGNKIENANYTDLSKIINSSELNPASRLNLFERYAYYIQKNFSKDKDFNETKLDFILKNVPKEEQVEILGVLNDSAVKMENSYSELSDLVIENRDTIKNIQQAGLYAKALYQLELDGKKSDDKSKFTTFENANNDLKNLIINKTILKHKYKTIDDFANETGDSELGGMAKDIIESFKTIPTNEIEEKYNKLVEQIFKDFSDIIALPLEKNMPTGMVFPELNSNLLNIKEGNIDSIITILKNEKKDGEFTDRAKNLQNAYKDYYEARFNLKDSAIKSFESTSSLENLYSKMKASDPSYESTEFSNKVSEKVKSLKINYNITAKKFDSKNLEKIATCILIAENTIKSLKANKDSKNDAEIKDNEIIISTLNNVLKGVYTSSAIEQSTVNSICSYINSEYSSDIEARKKFVEKIDKKYVEKQIKDTKQQIKSWHNVIDLIDSLGLSTAAEEGKVSERQQLINDIKASTSKSQIRKYIELNLKNKRISKYSESLTFEQIFNTGKTDKKYDIKKVEDFVNALITRINSQTDIECGVLNGILGKDIVQNEIKNVKTKYKKNKIDSNKDKVYDNIFDVLLNLTTDKTEEDLKTLIESDPKITPAKIAEKWKIDKKEFNKACKQIPNSSLSVEYKKSLWLKQKDYEKYGTIDFDFKEALTDAIKNGNVEKLEDFIKISKDKKNTDHKLYSTYLSASGFDIKNFEKLNKNKDIDSIKLSLSKIDGFVNKKIESFMEDKKVEIELLEIISNITNKSDKNLYDELVGLDNETKDIKEFNNKVNFLLSLNEKYKISNDVVNKAFEAFASGNSNFFESTLVTIPNEDGKVDSLSLATLIEQEGLKEFSSKDIALLKRLKISEKDIKDTKKRKKNLTNILNNINKKMEENKKNFDESYKKALKIKKEKPLEKQDNKERTGFFSKLKSIFSNRLDKVKNPEKEFLKFDNIKDKSNETVKGSESEKDSEKDSEKGKTETDPKDKEEEVDRESE